MKKKKRAKLVALSAKNWSRFFHYHDGGGRERAIKIGASLLACLALLIIAGAYRVEQTFAERSYLMSMLVPELAAPALAQENEAVLTAPVAPTPTESIPPTAPVADPAPSVAPTEPAPASPGAPASESHPAPAPDRAPPPPGQPQENGEPGSPAGEAGHNEEWERQNALQDRNNVLREMRDQKKELRRTCNQFKRLKNATADLTACNDLLAKVVEWENKIKSWSGGEAQELRDLMDDYRELQVWEELNLLRLKANLPRELNEFFRSLIRVERLLKQKSFQKIPGLNYEAINAKLAGMKAIHAGAKACYEAGDLECASEKLNEAREDGWPGELEGPLHNLRGINDLLRQIKNAEVKTEIIALIQPAIDSLNAGDWREAREEIDSYNQEVNIFLQYIIRGQQKRKGGPSDTLKRLEKLIDKHGGENGGDENERRAEPERRR